MCLLSLNINNVATKICNKIYNFKVLALMWKYGNIFMYDCWLTCFIPIVVHLCKDILLVNISNMNMSKRRTKVHTSFLVNYLTPSWWDVCGGINRKGLKFTPFPGKLLDCFILKYKTFWPTLISSMTLLQTNWTSFS